MTETRLSKIGILLAEVKTIGKQYRELTGKPLGITGEVAEFEAAEKLGLILSEARQPSYEAIRKIGNKITGIQIKGRRITKEMKRSQRIGSISLTHDWDMVILVILDDDFEPVEMYEALRTDIEKALREPGSKARNVRGALGVSKFKSISNLVWSREGNDA